MNKVHLDMMIKYLLLLVCGIDSALSADSWKGDLPYDVYGMFYCCCCLHTKIYLYALYHKLTFSPSPHTIGPGGCDDDTAILMEGSTTEVHVLPEGLLCETDVSFFCLSSVLFAYYYVHTFAVCNLNVLL